MLLLGHSLAPLLNDRTHDTTFTGKGTSTRMRQPKPQALAPG